MTKDTNVLHIEQLVKKLLSFYDEDIKDLLEKKYQYPISKCDEVVFLLLSKSTKTTRAILHLIELGYVEDTFVAARSLLENVINLKFLLEDQDLRENRASMFIEYAEYDWYKKVKHLSEVSTGASFIEECRKIVEQTDPNRYEEIRLKLKAINGRDNSWSGLSLREMAEECGLKDTYFDKAYFCLSQNAHCHYGGLTGYYSREGNIHLFEDLPNMVGAEDALLTTVDLYLQILVVLIDHTQIEVDSDQFHKLDEEFSCLLQNANSND